MEKLYYTSHDTELKTRVTESFYDEKEGKFKVKLEQTIFHPRCGGQDDDKGSINGHEILKFHEDYFYLENEIKVNDIAILSIDASIRRFNSRMHSLGHIIGYVFEKKGWVAIKASHYHGDCKVVFKEASNSDLNLEINNLEDEISFLINSKITQKIEIDSQQRRTVFFGDIKYFCGGTHVVDTSEIGGFFLKNFKINKGILTVSYELK